MKLTSLATLTVVLALVLATTGASAHDVRPGEKVRGEVAGAGAVELLDVDLAAGDTIKLGIKAQGNGGCAPAIALLDPDGATVASASDERKMKLVHVAEQTGTYQIRLSTDSASSSRFTLKVRGDESRSYTSRDRALEFGVRAGSRIDVKVKSRGESVVFMYDSAGDDVSASYSGSGRIARATVASASATDDHAIAFGPAGAKAKVKVRYPEARGALMLTMSAPALGNGSYSPPAAQGDDDEEDAPEDSADPVADGGDGSDSTGDGTVGGGSNDGTVNGGGNGTVPGPAALMDHSYLTDCIAEQPDAELDRVRGELSLLSDRPMSEVLNALRDAISDPIVDRIRTAPSIDAMVDLVAAQRRADRGERALALLTQEIGVSTLAGDPTCDLGQAQLASELATLGAAIEYALERGAEMMDDGTESAASAPASNEVIAGLAALDAAALNGAIMARARLLDPAAIEVASALYAGYETRLTQNVAADPNAPATLAAIQMARAELVALHVVVFGSEIDDGQVDDEQPSDPRPAADLLVRITDADGQAQAAHWELRTPGDEVVENRDGQALIGETDEDGQVRAPQVPVGDWVLVIHVEGHDEMRIAVAFEVPADEAEINLGVIEID